jgi:hypothetical protein
MDQPKKPGPIDLSSLKPPAQQPAVASAPITTPYRVEIKLVEKESITFEVPNAEEASKFMDSIHQIFSNNKEDVRVARFQIGLELYAIPKEKIIYAKLAQPQVLPGLSR